jgi:formate/nitrite transporter FocA (FNT family)
MWHMDPLLGKDLETHNEIKVVAMQQHGKHASTTMELLLETVLCNLLLGSCSSWITTVEMGVFSMWSMPRS